MPESHSRSGVAWNNQLGPKIRTLLDAANERQRKKELLIGLNTSGAEKIGLCAINQIKYNP